MSYFCKISFKTLKAEEIYPFFQNMKKEALEHFEEIAEENAFCCPAQRIAGFNDIPRPIAHELNRGWFCGTFTYRYFFFPKYNLLGVFSVDDCLYNLFDYTIEFQNSCDQDYPYETWDCIPLFKKISDKWKSSSDNVVKQHFKKVMNTDWEEEGPCDLDYYRRTFAYEEIWEIFEDYLYKDEQALHISLFSSSEISLPRVFVRMCKEAAEKKLKEDNLC